MGGSKKLRKLKTKMAPRRMATASTSGHLRRLYPHCVSSSKVPTPSAASNRKRKRSDAEADERNLKRRLDNGDSNTNTFHDVVHSFHAIIASSTHTSRSSSTTPSHAAFAEVYEWVGDAVIGELVGRCLLSQFHHAPLSARVFRNVRLSVVTNRNLAHVYDTMGYERQRYRHGAGSSDPRRRYKERADVVEAIIGELVVRLARQHSDAAACSLYRNHLDAVVAAMLRTHFADRTRARALGATSAGPLDVALNPFACLPEEQLDDVTGELVVRQGAFHVDGYDSDDASVAAVAVDATKSFADLLLDECEDATSDNSSHHAFAPVGSSSDTAAVPLAVRTAAAMHQLGDDHVLRTSREVFEVFKVYGMTVLAERVSLALALPHLVDTVATTVPLSVSPAGLTRRRQRVLSVAHLANCALQLGVVTSPVFIDRIGGDATASDSMDAQHAAHERLQANTLRAFVGFHSALATTTMSIGTSNDVVTGVCALLLQSTALDDDEEASTPVMTTTMPDRAPLASLLQSVREARTFMQSATCDALHLPGERPVNAAAAAAKRLRQAFTIRQCDSEQVDDLFATLAREHERATQQQQQQRQQATASRRSLKTKAKAKTKTPGSDRQVPALGATLARFAHRRFLFCLEDIIVLFAQRATDACRARIAACANELAPCADATHLRKWDVSTSTLTLAMRDSFYRLLLHDVCSFHAVVSSSKTTRDGTRITQLRLPLHYSWKKNVARRITTEQEATA